MKQNLALIFFIVAALLTLAWSTFPLSGAQDRVKALPASGFGFTSREVPLAPEETTVFGKAQVLKRLYQVRDKRFVLTAIDGSANPHAIHDPLFCFRGAGWKILSREIFPLPGGSAALVKLSRDATSQEVLFWISDDETRHAEPMRYWWQRTMRRITFGHSGAEPLMVILQPISSPRLDWHALLSDFPAIFNL